MNKDIKSKDCPICGGPIMFEYIHPTNDFYIEDGKIERDGNLELFNRSYVRFRCINDLTHDLESKTIVNDPDDNSLTEWMQKVEEIFYKDVLPNIGGN